MKVGVCSDLHVGSKKHKAGALRKFINECWDMGCKHIILAGDNVDGLGCYRGQEYDQSINGYGDQVDELLNVSLPHIQGIQYHLITGNHEAKAQRNVGIELHKYIEGRALCLGRDDIDCVGDSFGDIMLAGKRIHLWHPGGAFTNKTVQNYIESLDKVEVPDILIVGHYHFSRQEVYKNTVVLFPGCFQGRTSYMRQLALRPAIGGWILDIGENILPMWISC